MSILAQFHGLFIGIDKYKSVEVNELKCAVRDAASLYSIFSDTFGAGGTKLMIDAEATRKNIMFDFENRLFNVSPDDFVVITYSGHGSDNHHLVTHDLDPSNFSATSIALEELVDFFKKVPAKNLFLLLDCCFSGGAGAKVFHHQIGRRNIESTETILNRIGGQGRLIFTASGANEEAIEDRKKGHGLFTYYFAEALLGNPEVAQGGSINLYALLDFVTKQVTAAAEIFKHAQAPTFRGSVEGDLTFPIFKRGDIFARYFPEKKRAEVSSLIQTLSGLGIPDAILEIWKKKIPSLNRLQQIAINDHNLFDGDHLVVSAPTSSGKTMIAEIAAINCFFKNERTVILLPLRALVNDKFEDFQSKYSEYGIRIVRATGEISDDIKNFLKGRYDVAILTYEKFSNLLLGYPFILNNLGLVVVDEAQMLTDASRGINLEFLLTLLRSQRLHGQEPQILLLSAVLGQTNGLDRWLGARLLKHTERPVPLQEGLICGDGSFRYLDSDGNETRERLIVPERRKGSSQDLIVPLVRKLVADNEKIIVFRSTRGEATGAANYLATELKLPPAIEVIRSLPDGDTSASSAALRNCLNSGVAFHTSDLDRDERAVVEAAFRDPDGKVRVLVATTTVAMGINTPASSVIIAGLTHPQDQPYSVAEYKNMVGRAGRLGFVEKGKSFTVALNGAEEHRFWKHYVLGLPDDLHSRFGSGNLLSIVTRVLATVSSTKAMGMQTQDIIDFLQHSFAATQRTSGTKEWTSANIIQTITTLERNGLIEIDQFGYRLTALGKLSGETGVEVISIINLVSALRGSNLAEVSETDLIYATQIAVELDNVYFPTNRKSHQEQARWRDFAARSGLSRAIRASLEKNLKDASDGTCRFKKGAACKLWIDGVDLKMAEEELLQHMRDKDAAGSIRSTAGRTRDLLPVTSRICEILNGESVRISNLSEHLMIRLELGIPEDVVELAKLFGNNLNRAEYLALQTSGLTKPAHVFENLQRVDNIISSARKREFIRERLLDPVSASRSGKIR